MPSANDRSTRVNLAVEQAIQAVLSDRPIAYHAALAKALGSVTAGVLLSQLLYWQPRSHDADGWFWKTQKEVYEETALSRREHDTARLILKRAGVLEEKLKGVPARMHYRVNLGKLIELLSTYQIQSGGGGQSSLAESAKLVWRKAPNQNAENRQTITETTAETTPETRTETTKASKGPNSSNLITSNASRFSKTNVSKLEGAPDPDATRKPKPGGGPGFQPIGELLSYRKAHQLAQVSSETPLGEADPSPRATKRGRPPKATEWIQAEVERYSDEFHDTEHTPQNIGQAARLFQASGLSEAGFCQLMGEARAITKQYTIKKRALGEAGEIGFRNKMPYFFKVLRDLLGMGAHQAQAP